MDPLNSLRSTLEEACFEALDSGLTGGDIVRHMENSVAHSSSFSAREIRAYAIEVYDNVSEVLLHGK